MVSLVYNTLYFFFFQFYVSPKLAIFGLGVVPPVAMVAIVYGRYVRKITKKVQDSLADATEVSRPDVKTWRKLQICLA